MDCTEYYHNVNDILSSFKSKSKPVHCSVMKGERKPLWDLKKDDSCIILTAYKDVALVIIDNDTYSD